MRESSDRLSWISFLQVYAIILVVIGHSFYHHEDNIVYEWIYSFHMPLFFFISGHLLHVSVKRSGKPLGQYFGWRVLAKKARRLLLPYWLISSLVFVPKAFLGNFAGREVDFSWSGYAHMLLYPLDNVISIYWFLPTLFLVFCMPFIFMHDAGIIPGVSNETLMGITLTAFAVILAIIVGARRGYLDYVVVRCSKRMKNERRRKFFAFYRDTKSAISLLSKAPRCMLLVFLESGLNLLCIYAIVPCLLLGLGVTDADWYTVMGRMIFLNMLLYFTPTPGGSGIAEGGFVLLFSETVPAGTVGIVAVCWRLIAEYIPFLIGLYYTLTVFGRDFLNRQLNK